MQRDDLPTWVARRPITWGVLSALLMFAWVTVIVNPVVGVAVGLPVGIVNWWIWRPVGPARR